MSTTLAHCVSAKYRATVSVVSMKLLSVASATTSGSSLRDPAALGVGAGLQFVSSTLCNATLKFFCVGHDLSPVFVQHSLTLKMLAPRAHLDHCSDLNGFSMINSLGSAPVLVSGR